MWIIGKQLLLNELQVILDFQQLFNNNLKLRQTKGIYDLSSKLYLPQLPPPCSHMITFWALGNLFEFTTVIVFHNHMELIIITICDCFCWLLEFLLVSGKKCPLDMLDSLNNQMICLITAMISFTIDVKIVVKSSPVTWCFNLQQLHCGHKWRNICIVKTIVI